MQVIMVWRPEAADDPTEPVRDDPFDGIEIVKVLDDNMDAMAFIEAFEASVQTSIVGWKWHIEPVKGSYLPPDFSEDLAHPYKGRSLEAE